jgi:hypothetical protein
VQLDKEKIRLLVQSIGYQEASKQTGIKYATLRQMAKRGKWNDVVPKYQNAIVTQVTNPRTIADIHADTLRSLERETKLSFAKYSAKAARDSESATLRDSPYVHKAAQTASIVHNWGNDDKKPNAILNVAILTGAEKPEKIVEAREVESSPQDTSE